MTALDVHVVDRRRERVLLGDGRSLRIVATGDHHGHPCRIDDASHAVALDDRGEAHAVNVPRMTAHPLGRLASSILCSEAMAE